MTYPRAEKENQQDNYHGTIVADPYRWLEDDNSPRTHEWVEAENKVTFDFLDKIPEREAIKHRLTELWNFERYGIPSKEGGRYFISRNDGLQNQSVVYTMESLDAEPKMLLDPNTLSSDGTVALAGENCATTLTVSGATPDVGVTLQVRVSVGLVGAVTDPPPLHPKLARPKAAIPRTVATRVLRARIRPLLTMKPRQRAARPVYHRPGRPRSDDLAQGPGSTSIAPRR